MSQPTDLIGRIGEAITPAVEAMGFALVRISYTGSRRPVLQIMAERENGEMSIEDCAELSRVISALLDVEDPIAGEYTLEVSSPGIDRPLTRPKDFERFAGHLAKVETAQPVQGRRRFRGVLGGLAASGEMLLLEDEACGRVELPLALLLKARLVLTDALIAESLKQRPQPAADTKPQDKFTT
ncbi:MAG: ribosome maturation factor RimP [Pseudomonadota bacterium]|jgi:ribosome maturation factor RimP|nr:ribosome maturation factor RimP [Alphaproteobacteria bacterium]